MAVVETAQRAEPDAPPLWLPRHGRVAVEQSAARPPDSVEGYTWLSRIATMMFGSRWKTFTRAATAVTVLVFMVALPSLAGGGWANLFKVAFYQSWTLVILLAATWRVRSVSIPTVATYWLTGMFSTILIVHFVSGPVADLTGGGWFIPALEELARALPLIMAVVVGRRLWRHPGLCDLMILGFAVGGGYAFHEDALWERASVSGIEANAGLFVPSIFQQDNIFMVGHAAWTAIVGLAIGLLVLHRRQAILFMVATFALLAVLGDNLAVNDQSGTLDSVRETFGSRLLALLLVGGVVAAIILDQRRLDAMAAHDHLFPTTDRRFLASNAHDDPDFFATILVGRYRRVRNGVHTTIDASGVHWPPLSQAPGAPVAELARRARAADITVGPGSSAIGWAQDPGAPGGQRFVGPDGFTPYITVGEELAVSAPRSRPDATAVEISEEAEDFLNVAARLTFVLVFLAVLRLLTAGDTAPVDVAGEQMATLWAGLSEAPNAPPLIPTIIGGSYAVLAALGLNRPEPGAGWELGPADGAPFPHDECEA